MSLTIADVKDELKKNLASHRRQVLSMTKAAIRELEVLERRLENDGYLPPVVALSNPSRLENTYQQAVAFQDALDLLKQVEEPQK